MATVTFTVGTLAYEALELDRYKGPAERVGRSKLLRVTISREDAELAASIAEARSDDNGAGWDLPASYILACRGAAVKIRAALGAGWAA